MYDIITIGETMLRFTPVGGLRWEQADQLQVHIGGSESNTAIGLARLGLRVAWLSRLTDNAWGRKIANTIAYHGVDTQHIVWTNQDRIGTYYYEEASEPRGNQVMYDRAGSAFSNFSFEQLPVELFEPKASRWLHFTGISLGLGEVCCGLIHRAVQLAKAAGWKVSFDVNYRGKLWSAQEASQTCLPYLELADVVFLPIRDARLLWGIKYNNEELDRDPASVASRVASAMYDAMSGTVAKKSNESTLVMTLGSQGACAMRGRSFYFAPTTTVPAVGRLGGGDAFTAGFLSGLLRSNELGSNDLDSSNLHSNDLERALNWGNAAARLKYSIPGDIPFFSLSEVEKLATAFLVNSLFDSHNPPSLRNTQRVKTQRI